MNCKTCSEWMLRLSELNESELQVMNGHLDSCKSCRMLYDNLQMLDRIIEREKNLKPDPMMHNRIMNAIEQKGSVKVRLLWQSAVRTSLVAASISMAIWMGIKVGGLYNTSSQKQTTDQEFAYVNDAAMESVNTLIMK